MKLRKYCQHLYIRDLRVPCVIGAYDHERLEPQDLKLNLKLMIEDTLAAKTDQLSDAVDYDRLAQSVAAFVRGSQFKLLEALALATIEFIFSFDPKIDSLDLEIEKPQSIAFTRSAGLFVSASRKESLIQ